MKECKSSQSNHASTSNSSFIPTKTEETYKNKYKKMKAHLALLNLDNQTKNGCLFAKNEKWEDSDDSSDDEEETRDMCFMTLDSEQIHLVKDDVISGHWVDIILKKKVRLFLKHLSLKRSATNVIEKWVNEGNQITINDLCGISKELRKSQRYKHALKLSEWMVSRGDFELSVSDYAFRIDLMTKVFGIDAAERYFESLPPSAKTTESYTALLHCYAASKLTSKAEDLYERIKGSNLPLSAITYNELMTLYMSVGQVEKVSSVIEELKNQNVSPDIYTYNLWISSCASALKIDDVRNILDEMAAGEPCPSESWARYVNLVKIYLTSGQLVNSEVNSVVESEKGITQREWITYDFLIILHCALGNKDTLDQIWKSLRMTNQKMISRNYACILSAYVMLGHFNKVEEVINQWKTSATTDFDMSVCDRLTKAFQEVGMIEKAEAFRVLLSEKCDPQ